jgi:ferrochelatase
VTQKASFDESRQCAVKARESIDKAQPYTYISTMKFIGQSQFDHQQPARIGVLVTNLGTPDAPERGALKRYLKQFLWDPRVVEVPRPLWWLILNGIILNVRPSRSAAAYRTVWTEAGSPLLLHTKAQAEALQQSLGEDVAVAFAMRYGNPGIEPAIDQLLATGVRKLVVLPLYPQYSGPTGGSTFDAVTDYLRRRRWVPELRFLNHYCDHPAYIAALAESVREHWEQHGRADKLLLSYHGEPQRYLDQGDPYYCQCQKTSRLLAAALELNEDQYLTTFQSRFGREPWLKPYTDDTLRELPGQGVKSVQVVCPGFAADCLETLEEIGVENRSYFEQAGGERYEYIPCLNTRDSHIEALSTIAREQLQGWLEDAQQ